MDKATGFEVFLIIIAALVLVALIFFYRNSKAASESERFNASLQQPIMSSMPSPYATAYQPPSPGGGKRPQSPPPSAATPPPTSRPAAAVQTVLPAEPLNNEQYRAVDFAPPSSSGGAGPVANRRLTAEDLLPKDAANTKWAQVTPSGQGELRDLNFVTAGWHIGVNTQGQSLRNANLSIRSEPINPQFKVSPWNMSTVEPDVSRRGFDIS